MDKLWEYYTSENEIWEIVMPDPVTLTASAIASLAFQEFVKSGAADEAIEKAKAVEKEGIDTVVTLLGVELLDKEFAGQVQAIA
jgi:hypothetical protein